MGLIAMAFIESLGWHVMILPDVIIYQISRVVAAVFAIDTLSLAIVFFVICQIIVFLTVLHEKVVELQESEYAKVCQAEQNLEKEAERLKSNLLRLTKEKELDYNREVAKLNAEDQALKRRLELDYNRKVAKLNAEEQALKRQLERSYNRKYAELVDKEWELKQLLESSQPFKSSAAMMADISAAIFKGVERNLREKIRPALTAAKEVKRMRGKHRDLERQYREILYKYEFLLSSFPELGEYVDNDEELVSLAQYDSYEELEENRDKSRDYLSKEEWDSMTTTQRNQLALDRYIARQKSPSQIGRDFEMFCAWRLECEGFQVIRYGIKKGLEDLGRDLIAWRRLADASEEVYVIQCKCWKKERLIRENVVAQLCGTTFAYSRDTAKERESNQRKIIPVIMFPEFSSLSDVACDFCKKLGVVVSQVHFENFPRIKCNINGQSKIYHLPFDQQYNRTDIKNPGEFYAWTVSEAEAAGFRRAQKHFNY